MEFLLLLVVVFVFEYECTISASSEVKLSRYMPWRHMGGEEV
jgi:hypothetical protein